MTPSVVQSTDNVCSDAGFMELLIIEIIIESNEQIMDSLYGVADHTNYIIELVNNRGASLDDYNNYIIGLIEYTRIDSDTEYDSIKYALTHAHHTIGMVNWN